MKRTVLRIPLDRARVDYNIFERIDANAAWDDQCEFEIRVRISVKDGNAALDFLARAITDEDVQEDKDADER